MQEPATLVAELPVAGEPVDAVDVEIRVVNDVSAPAAHSMVTVVVAPPALTVPVTGAAVEATVPRVGSETVGRTASVVNVRSLEFDVPTVFVALKRKW